MRSLLLPLGFLGAAVLGTMSPEYAQHQISGESAVVTNNVQLSRAAWEFEQRAFPLGDIPDGALRRAMRTISDGAALDPGDRESWENVGPAPILPGQFSGRVVSIAVDPESDDHWLIGAGQGGVWETKDAGATWNVRTDDQESLAMGAIAFAPNRPRIIYAGTGEASFSGDSYAGAGLLKSTDGGASWRAIAVPTFDRLAFSDIAVKPDQARIVLAATTSAGFGRGFSRSPASPTPGIFRSVDGGAMWIKVLTGEASDLEVNPENFYQQYAGIGNPTSDPRNGLYRSEDGGQSWAVVDGPWNTLAEGVGRVELAIAPSDPEVLYIAIQDAFDASGGDGGLLGIWMTNNAWSPDPTWLQLSPPAICGTQCWYDLILTVDRGNSTILYAGGIALYRYNGTTWTSILGPIHVDQHAFAWVGNRLIVGNDGGVFSTPNGGTTWSNHNTNLSITQFYDGRLHPSDPDFVLAGSQDNGTERWTGQIAWQQFFGGDGGDNAIATNNPNYWAFSTQNLFIRRTLNGGLTSVAADAGIDRTGAPFIARLEKCPYDDDVFIAGSNNLWRTTNFFSGSTATWTANGPEMNVPITAVAFASADVSCRTYAFGTSTGQLRLTTDGGETWNDLDTSGYVPNRYVTDLAFDDINSNILYVTLSGFDEGTPGQPGHVFKTLNATAAVPAWSNVSPPVNLPANSIAIAPFRNAIYAGTDRGVWRSRNGGVRWIHMGPRSGMPNVAVFELQVNPVTEVIAAFTHGRGAFLIRNHRR
jgi:photosystem II stability/assembly factor-like uncharacterized protein